MFKLKFKQKMKPNFLLCLTLRRKAPRAVLARQTFLNRIVRYIGSFIAEKGELTSLY